MTHGNDPEELVTFETVKQALRHAVGAEDSDLDYTYTFTPRSASPVNDKAPLWLWAFTFGMALFLAVFIGAFIGILVGLGRP